MATAEIVAIGSELLLGQITDTNSPWMAQRLAQMGINLYFKTIVGDNPTRMKEVLTRALGRADLVITSGGLGPTQADVTREIIAKAAGRPLVRDARLLAELEQRFRSRGFIMTANNERQADIPEGAIPVSNPNGTAPSFIVETDRSALFALPGVPFELKWLFEHEVMPYARKRFGITDVITYRVLKVAEIGESNVDHRIGHLIATSKNPTVGVLASPGQVDVRIAVKAANQQEARRLIEPVELEIRRLLGRHIFAADSETMEDAVGKLLHQKKVTVASYEDLTYGLLAERLEQAGPEHFIEGVVGNGMATARRLLAISRNAGRADELARRHLELADELAWAVRKEAGTDLAVALHAVADPTDTSENLSRGETYISVTDGERFRRRSYNSAGRGRPDRTRMSLDALELVRVALIEGF
ncbi:MAG: CinA family nicotinamide mononucleotide deamidase-related protein [SAR202 cluster bacterium]|nr:CinA family nicotinamide mononucleotide deamidase-related protein [SAR202 cluster bacterium]